MKKTRTWQYLWPAICLTQPEGFVKITGALIREGAILNTFIGDTGYKQDIPEQALFLLIKMPKNGEGLVGYFRDVDIFLDTYTVDEDLIMIVLKVEDKKAFTNFMESKYSKMYSKSFLLNPQFVYSETGGVTTYIQAHRVLTRSEEYAQEIIKDLALDPDIILPELDEVIDTNDEVFDLEKYKAGYWN